MTAPALTPAERDIIRRARERITDPENWTTGYLAQSSLGRRIGPLAPGACKWCAAGAIIREADDGADADLLLDRIYAHLTLHEVNDIDGHAAVLAELDRLAAGGDDTNA